MRIACSGLLLSSLLTAASCGTQATLPAQPPVAETQAPTTPPTTPSEESAKPEATEPVPDAEPAPATPAAKADPDPNATREVTYVVVPEGLKVSVAGVRFAVSASAAQVASGWGVKLNVVATAVDGKPHSLSSPKAGPLAFAGSVLRKGKSEPEPFGDERAGDGEQSIFGDDATKFSRTWPAKGGRVLGAGDSLDLQVALWGLGTEKDSRRPVKKFCHVRMQVDKGKPRAIVEPPKDVSGK